jgi:hypothetical protein
MMTDVKQWLIGCLCWLNWPVAASQWVVDTTVDLVDVMPGDGLCQTVQNSCSLRAAISSSNETASVDSIVIPAGHYQLSLAGANEDFNQSGDLDVLQPVMMQGAGQTEVVIDGLLLDRILDIQANGPVEISGVSLSAGRSHSVNRPGTAIDIHQGSALIIRDSTVSGNNHPDDSESAAILQRGELLAERLRVQDNQGSALHIDGPSTRIHDSLISGHNRLVIKIEGLVDFGEHELLEITNSTLVNNHGNEGIMFVGSFIETINIINTTVTHNSGSYLFFNDNFSTLNFINSTLYNNQIDAFNGSVNVDVHNSSAEKTRYFNTIMTNQGEGIVSEADIGGFSSLGGNYFARLHGQLQPLPSDDIDPTGQVGLIPLKGASGLVVAYVPAVNSPALDAGLNAGCPAWDQRQQERPADGNLDGQVICDRGAVEHHELVFMDDFEASD